MAKVIIMYRTALYALKLNKATRNPSHRNLLNKIIEDYECGNHNNIGDNPKDSYSVLKN